MIINVKSQQELTDFALLLLSKIKDQIPTTTVITEGSQAPAQVDLTAVYGELNNKVSKEGSKVLSTNDYTDADKAKVSSAVSNAELSAAFVEYLQGLPGFGENKVLSSSLEWIDAVAPVNNDTLPGTLPFILA